MINVYHYNELGSNKIWGWTNAEDCNISFWGRVRGTLSFKRYETSWDGDIYKDAEKKQRKGYHVVVPSKHETVLPSDFKGQLMLAKLGMSKF